MKQYPLIAKVTKHRKGISLLMDARAVRALNLKAGSKLCIERKNNDIFLLSKIPRQRSSVEKPKNWDSFFDSLSRLTELKGFLSDGERVQPHQDRDPFDD